jgi:hypothetical protein
MATTPESDKFNHQIRMARTIADQIRNCDSPSRLLRIVLAFYSVDRFESRPAVFGEIADASRRLCDLMDAGEYKLAVRR